MIKAVILIGDYGNVDFEAPVEMTPEEQKKFISFLKTLFKVVEIDEKAEPRHERLGDKNFMRTWTVDEYKFLLENEETEKVAELLGRSWMSVDIKRGSFFQEWQEHLQLNNIDPTKGDLKELIKDFLKSKEAFKSGKKEKKKELNRLKKKLEAIPQRLKEVEFFKKMGKATQQDVNDLLAHEEELKSRIAELEK